MIQIELLTVVLMKIKIYICYILLYTVIYCTTLEKIILLTKYKIIKRVSVNFFF